MSTISLISKPAVVISAQRSFFLWKQTKSSRSLEDAVEEYAMSPQFQAVSLAVDKIDIAKSSLSLGSGIGLWETETLRTLIKVAHENGLGVD